MAYKAAFQAREKQHYHTTVHAGCGFDVKRGIPTTM